MTPRELRNEIKFLKVRAFMDVRNSSPVRTGNLQNSVRAVDRADGGFEIYIDTKQAPYAIYTLEQWVHPRWNGKKNPNEGWAYHASKTFTDFVKIRLERGGR